MLKIHLITFQILLLCFALLNKKHFIYGEGTNKDIYTSTLKDLEFKEDQITNLSNENVRNPIYNLISSNFIILYFHSMKRFKDSLLSDIEDIIKKANFKMVFNDDLRDKLEKFTNTIRDIIETDVDTCLNTIFNGEFNITKAYYNFVYRYVDISSIITLIFSRISIVSENINVELNKYKNTNNIINYKEFIKNNKDKISQFKYLLIDMKKHLYGIDALKNEILLHKHKLDLFIDDYKEKPENSKYLYIINQFKEYNEIKHLNLTANIYSDIEENLSKLINIEKEYEFILGNPDVNNKVSDDEYEIETEEVNEENDEEVNEENDEEVNEENNEEVNEENDEEVNEENDEEKNEEIKGKERSKN